ncbi:hypothetical protein [Nocardiopsis dassonvillei]|uniref:hypothetical protein n=1 Tax=Nocardiopsis dassonvillei TaxID=2014 RepID=UPI00367059D4
MTAKDELVARLRGRADAQAEADQRTREDHAEAKRKDDTWIRERSRELQDSGLNIHVAHDRAKRELRAKKMDEAATRDRERTDEAIRAIAERDQGASDRLIDQLRKKASTPADFEERVAEERAKRRVAAHVDSEQQD